MAYTVKKLAKLSGVSIRTLHFYDEVGLLKPAYHGVNGYRFYEEAQLLLLQQILFYRELGFELKKIQKILGRSDFDKVSALHSHRKVLVQDIERNNRLVETIDKTIEHLIGKKPMKAQDMFNNFSKEKQAEYDKYLENRLGANHPALVEAKKNAKNWTQEAWDAAAQKNYESMKEMAHLLLEKGAKPDSAEVQKKIRELYEWVSKIWTPNRESFTALGQMYVEFEWKTFFGQFDPNHPKLASLIAEAMKIFADRELS